MWVMRVGGLKKLVFGSLLAIVFVLYSITLLMSFYPQQSQLLVYDFELSCKTAEIYIPIIQNELFNSEWEIESNNYYTMANGPLLNGKQYFGFPDPNDYFRFEIETTGLISIRVENYTGSEPQVQLIYDHPEHILNPTIPYTYTCPDNLCQLEYVPPPNYIGSYFVFISADNSTNISYTLIVNYPVLSPPSSTSIPYCTQTFTPTPTPSITPSHTPGTTLCEFEPISAGFSVLFPEGLIVANGTITDAITTAVPSTPISPGIYQVTMYSYDDHTTKAEQTQTHEIWYLRLKNEDGDIIATAGPSADIPDGAGNDCQGVYLEDMLILVDTAVSADALHAAFSESKPNPDPHSVNPDYALLVPVRMVAHPPTQTPTPTYLATQTPTP